MKVLITLGPTQEPIDDVRYITNASSGKTGVALAEEGLMRGHDVTLVCGPVNVRMPDKAKVFSVRTAEEMVDKTLELLKSQDMLISTAAIADYTPENKARGKIKSGSELVLKLKPTRKLIKEARAKYPGLFIVGFKAEYGVDEWGLIDAAKRTLAQNKLDLIVANDLKKNIFSSIETESIMIDDKGTERISRTTKDKAAKIIWNQIEKKITP